MNIAGYHVTHYMHMNFFIVEKQKEALGGDERSHKKKIGTVLATLANILSISNIHKFVP